MGKRSFTSVRRMTYKDTIRWLWIIRKQGNLYVGNISQNEKNSLILDMVVEYDYSEEVQTDYIRLSDRGEELHELAAPRA